MKESQLRKIIKETILSELESHTKVGVKFNDNGITWEVIKVGKTSSRAKAITKSANNKTKEFDNKTINKLKESIIEAQYHDKDQIGMAMNYAIEELEGTLKHVRNPEKWAETYFRSAGNVIDSIEKLVVIFNKMK